MLQTIENLPLVTDVTVIVGDSIIVEDLPVDEILITVNDLPEPKNITLEDLTSVLKDIDLTSSIILPIVTTDTCDLIDDFVRTSSIETLPVQLGDCPPKIQIEDAQTVDTISDVKIEPEGKFPEFFQNFMEFLFFSELMSAL